MWSRIEFEDELPPSFDALWRHWQQTCWVSNMWTQAASNHMRVLDLTQYGCIIVDGSLSVIGSRGKQRGSETTSGPTVSRLLMFKCYCM